VVLAFPIGAAVVAAVCGWPGSYLAVGLSEPGETTPSRAEPAARVAAAGRPAGKALLASALVLAALSFAAAVRVHPMAIACAACWLVICGLPLTVSDMRSRRLPDVLTWASFAGVAVLLTAAGVLGGQGHALARAACGAASVAGFFAVLALLKPGSAGLGDAKLGLSTGALATWAGWGVLLVSVFVAFALAAACGLWLLATGRASLRGGSAPFGPFLLAGCVLAIVLAG